MNSKYSNCTFRRIGYMLLILLLALANGVNAEPKKHQLGDIPLSEEAYQKHLKKIPMDMVPTIETAMPSAYDARSEFIVTPAKNQGSCGSCWAFASVGALESHILKTLAETSEPDLSEQQQVSCNTAMLGCTGGSSTAIRYWENKGPEDEVIFPYTASDQTPCYENQMLGYRVTDWHTVPVTTEDFKTSLYIYGPSYWRFTVYSDFDTYWNYGALGQVYTSAAGATYRGGHAVLLIGWDDAKNAFLCKNSWGETDGPNNDGTFWIAYDGHFNNLGFGMTNFRVTSLSCSSDAQCDDGNACNGIETCVSGACQEGDPVICNDDNLFCNGSESCDEYTGECIHSNLPCNDGETCNENNDICVPLGCGNGVCDEGENCINCDADCISGTGGGTCGACFKGVCDGVCHPVKEGPDCADCAPSYCCGDGVCNGAENSNNCAVDCGQPPTPGTEICTGGADEDGDGLIDCADPDCINDENCLLPPPTCGEKKAPCDVNEDCCSNKCVNHVCR